MLVTADPRPHVVDGRVAGLRCRSCGYPTASATAWCPLCCGPQEEARFGPGGRVWAATVVRLAVGGRTPPYALAYVDLDDGPRVLARLDAAVAPAPGTRVAVAGDDDGDLVVRIDHGAPGERNETMAQGA